LGDFLANLDGAKVYRSVVHYDRTRVPMGDKHQRDATSFEIFFNASAVLEFDDEGQALLQCGEHCGIDRLTADGGTDGTDRQLVLMERLGEFCNGRSLNLKPGLIDM
jgi:hypothetical protein